MLDIQEKEFEKVQHVLFIYNQKIFFILPSNIWKSPAQPQLLLEYLLKLVLSCTYYTFISFSLLPKITDMHFS